MFVMGKLDGELPLVFRFGRLISSVGFAKGEPRLLARRSPQVTDRTNCRTRAAESLPAKELWPVTANAGIVIGKVGRIRKIAFGIPRRRNPVAAVAGEAFMFVRSMEEGRVLRGRTARRLLLGRWLCWTRPTPSLRHGYRSDGGDRD